MTALLLRRTGSGEEPKRFHGCRVVCGENACRHAHEIRDFRATLAAEHEKAQPMIRKLKSGEYRLYSRKVNPKTGRRRNLGTFKTRAAAEKHERAVQYFKRAGG